MIDWMLRLQSSPLRLGLPTVLTTFERENRMLRQHSQPETSCYHCQIGSGTAASTSLRQLKEASTGDAIAGIAADTLRINGAIRQFRQVAFPVGPIFNYFFFYLLPFFWTFFPLFFSVLILQLLQLILRSSYYLDYIHIGVYCDVHCRSIQSIQSKMNRWLIELRCIVCDNLVILPLSLLPSGCAYSLSLYSFYVFLPISIFLYLIYISLSISLSLSH